MSGGGFGIPAIAMSFWLAMLLPMIASINVNE